MSHNLSVSQGVVEMFCAGAPAWHGLGVNVEKAQSWKDASKLAHLDWTITKHQFASPIDGKTPVDAWGLFRDDTGAFLSPAGSQYTVIQNADAFGFTDALLGQDVRFASAGALGAGEIMWCLAKLPTTIEPVKGDKSDTYLLFTDRRDGGAATVKLTTTRVVCNNTLNIALRDKVANTNALRLRHSSGVKDKLEAAKTLVGAALKNVKDIEAKFKRLAEKKVDAPKLQQILAKLFPNIENSTRQQNQARDVLMAYDRNDGDKIAGIRGTAWSLANAFSWYVDHERNGIRSGDRDPAIARAESAMFGSGDEFKNEALDRICEIMGIGEAGEIVTAKSGSRVDNIMSQIA